MCLNLKPIFENDALYQNNETQLWHQIHTHKIVHSSAMYYHNLNVIRKGSKKLLTIKTSKSIFNTYYNTNIKVQNCLIDPPQC